MGDVSVSWKNSDSGFTLDVAIPENTSADIVLPELGIENPVLVIDGKQSASTYQPGATLTLTGGAHSLALQAR
jgi:hypothetical protein